ncbi:hypothetical protein SAMN05421819_2080 [Bryocella elongata]|uniref:Uncharacterized protein n=1 Tax=Bryocella elongata TaxID=863522 RepID=A0A1H5Y2F7_9BACT|nr:hypothetical protein SAMN05421819_2080 [Bryocella elongata]
MQDVAIFFSFVTFVMFPCYLAYRSGTTDRNDG